MVERREQFEESGSFGEGGLNQTPTPNPAAPTLRRYPGSKAIDENKVILKRKYTLAKSTGELVNKARGSINYLKTTIEGLRRERAMERMVEGGDGEEGGEGKVDEEEEGMRAEIEKEKRVYKEQFGILRGLKSEIEHIQRMLEKGRTKMQQDFDVWYKNSEEFHSRYGGRVVQAPSGRGQENLAPAPAEPKAQQAWVGGAGAGAGAGGESAGVEEGKYTGNKETDDDIRAFFKAKEELIKRRQQQAK